MSESNGSEKGTSPAVQTELRGEILMVKLSRQEKRNAVNDEMIQTLEKVFSTVPSEVKCAVLYGEGKHFSAGLDLSELKETDVMEGLYHSRMWHNALDRLQFGKVPIVAVVHGACVGGGLELASACHIRVAEASTFYALPEGQRGIFVGGSASVRIPKLIGMARMADMMFTGRVITAEEGNIIGLSQYLVPDGKGVEKGIELATKICSNTITTNYGLMHVLPRIVDASQDQALMMESLIAAISQTSAESKERLSDFLKGKAKRVGE